LLTTRPITRLLLAAASIVLLSACGEGARSGTIGSLYADEALAYSQKLQASCGDRDIVHLLRFVHYYKLGKRDAALVALELANDEISKRIVEAVREQRNLSDQSETIDLNEGIELRAELQGPLSECERMVRSGQFTPLTGPQFCVLWDSGILDLLPMPGELLTVSERLAARKLLQRLPREELREKLRTLPRAAAVVAKHEAERVALRQAVTASARLQDEFIKQLLDVEWNVARGLTDA